MGNSKAPILVVEGLKQFVMFGHTSYACFFNRPLSTVLASPVFLSWIFSMFFPGYFDVLSWEFSMFYPGHFDVTKIGPRYLWPHFFDLLLLPGSRCFRFNVLTGDVVRFKRR